MNQTPEDPLYKNPIVRIIGGFSGVRFKYPKQAHAMKLVQT
jgi:hypothetical protein